jgi:hypothetical protein
VGTRYTDHMDEFADEVRYQVGERVKVRVAPDLIPEEEIECGTGVVRKIYTKFMLTPKMRRFVYEVWLDGPYHPYVRGAAVAVNREQLEKVE